jgi:hypothetical protein
MPTIEFDKNLTKKAQTQNLKQRSTLQESCQIFNFIFRSQTPND